MKMIKYSFLFFVLAIIVYGCSKEETGELTSSFSVSTLEAETGDVLNFNNTSENATSYTWDFGDGNTSTIKSPSHTFEIPGNYEIKLTSSDESTFSSSTESIRVFTLPNGTYSAESIFVLQAFAVNGGAIVPGGNGEPFLLSSSIPIPGVLSQSELVIDDFMISGSLVFVGVGEVLAYSFPNISLLDFTQKDIGNGVYEISNEDFELTLLLTE